MSDLTAWQALAAFPLTWVALSVGQAIYRFIANRGERP